jgi:hypothetical protein
MIDEKKLELFITWKKKTQRVYTACLINKCRQGMSHLGWRHRLGARSVQGRFHNTVYVTAKDQTLRVHVR